MGETGEEAAVHPSDTAIRWRRGQVLGRGRSGTVYLGLSEATGQMLAVKVVDVVGEDGQANGVLVARLRREVELMSRLRHPNIVRYLGGQLRGDKYHVFMEHMPGGNLRTLRSRFGSVDEGLVRVYVRQMLEGLAFLHRNGVAHRDVKGANVLVAEDGTIRLADFGSAKELDAVATSPRGEAIGTVKWMAPEVARGNQPAAASATSAQQSSAPTHGGSNALADASVDWTKADVWSLGCTIVELVTGEPPWSDLSNPFTALYHIACSGESPTVPESLSLAGRSFLARCFSHDTNRRPSAEQLLSHSFVKDTDPAASATHIAHLATRDELRGGTSPGRDKQSASRRRSPTRKHQSGKRQGSRRTNRRGRTTTANGVHTASFLENKGDSDASSASRTGSSDGVSTGSSSSSEGSWMSWSSSASSSTSSASSPSLQHAPGAKSTGRQRKATPAMLETPQKLLAGSRAGSLVLSSKPKRRGGPSALFPRLQGVKTNADESLASFASPRDTRDAPQPVSAAVPALDFNRLPAAKRHTRETDVSDAQPSADGPERTPAQRRFFRLHTAAGARKRDPASAAPAVVRSPQAVEEGRRPPTADSARSHRRLQPLPPRSPVRPEAQHDPSSPTAAPTPGRRAQLPPVSPVCIASRGPAPSVVGVDAAGATAAGDSRPPSSRRALRPLSSGAPGAAARDTLPPRIRKPAPVRRPSAESLFSGGVQSPQPGGFEAMAATWGSPGAGGDAEWGGGAFGAAWRDGELRLGGAGAGERGAVAAIGGGGGDADEDDDAWTVGSGEDVWGAGDGGSALWGSPGQSPDGFIPPYALTVTWLRAIRGSGLTVAIARVWLSAARARRAQRGDDARSRTFSSSAPGSGRGSHGGDAGARDDGGDPWTVGDAGLQWQLDEAHVDRVMRIRDAVAEEAAEAEAAEAARAAAAEEEEWDRLTTRTTAVTVSTSRAVAPGVGAVGDTLASSAAGTLRVGSGAIAEDGSATSRTAASAGTRADQADEVPVGVLRHRGAPVVRSVADFEGADEGELSVALGSRLVVIERDDSGWWLCRVVGVPHLGGTALGAGAGGGAGGGGAEESSDSDGSEGGSGGGGVMQREGWMPCTYLEWCMAADGVSDRSWAPVASWR